MKQLKRTSQRAQCGLFTHKPAHWSTSLFFKPKPQSPGLQPSGWQAFLSLTIVMVMTLTSVGGVFLALSDNVQAASAGPRYATASGDCVSQSGVGTVAWTNPGNAYSNTDAQAAATVVLPRNITSHYLKCTNFGFTTGTIPNGSTINGIEVTINRRVSTSDASAIDNQVRIVKGGTIGTTEMKTATQWPSAYTSQTYGGSSNLWGEAWTVSDVTASNFGLALSAIKNGNPNASYTFSVDYIGITIHYTAPPNPWTTITQRQGTITNDQNNTVLASHTAKIGERMRVYVQVDTNSGDPASKALKLQYDKNSSGSWVDVAPTNEIRPARSSITGLDEDIGTGQAGSCTGGVTAGRGYIFQDRGTTKPIQIAGSGCHDIGFVVDTKNATANTTYRFRLYDVTGASTLNTYSAYPSFNTVTSSNDTTHASKSNTTSLSSTQSDLKTLLDNQGYSNINPDDAAREILQNVGSDTTADMTMTGESTSNTFGSVAAKAGDVNGDGYDDVIVGASGYSSSAGRAYIYYGGISADTTADVTITGSASDQLGSSVAWAGDINFDGYDDVIVGAKGYSSSTGRAYIYYGGVSMDTTADITFTGEATSNNFGCAVANAGDANGDGYNDILIGANGHSTNTGKVYLYLGSSSMDNTVDVTVTPALPATGDSFGSSVAGVGDINGDGYDEIAAGAPGKSSGNGQLGILLGRASFNASYSPNYNLSVGTGTLLGTSVSGAGDVNGDGYSDVLVGGPGYTTNTGRAYILYGSSSFDSTVDVTLTGESTNHSFGQSVASVGDINGDGYDDVMVGASGYDVGSGTNEGRAYVYYGGSSMDTTADATMTGGAASDAFGSVVSLAGDTNGDGFNDLIVGASGYSTSTGRAYIYHQSYQANNTADKTMTGAVSTTFGISMSAGGDVNGDGYGDVVVGAQGYSTSTGRVYIFYGGTTMDTTADVTLTGETTNNFFGNSVSNIGDVNGDGYADVVVGARGYSTSTGRVYVFYGGASMSSSIAASSANVTMTGEATSNVFGVSMSSGGDVNGDGYGDVVVGAYGYSSSTGRAYVFYGGASMNNVADVTMTGTSSNDSLGRSVDNSSDMNGDGYVDVVMGVTGASSNFGQVRVFHGGATMDNTADVTMTGEIASTSFGAEVSNGGDVNGDGYGDLIVGAEAYDSSKGRAYAFWGGSSMDSTADFIATGAAASDNFASSVSNSSDLNGDGYVDIIVGGFDQVNLDDTGFAYIYYGGVSIDTTIDITLTGETTSSAFGGSLSAADINGDGYGDVTVGAYGYNPGGGATGRSYIYLGGRSSYAPTFNMAQKHNSACSGLTSIDGSWNGQSSVAASTNNMLLQVYRYGSTNAWETVDTESSLAANTDGTLNGSKTTNLSEYCDGSNWSYWRTYQASGTQTLQADDFDVTFTASGSNTAPNSPTSPAQNKVTGGATVATGGWTNENQIRLSASATDPDASDTLQLCVEKELLGTAFDGVGEVCGTGVAYSGSGVTVSVDVTGLSEGEYHWQARIKDAGGLYSSWVSYDVNAESARDFGVDTSVPTGTVYDGSSAGIDASLNNGSLTSLSGNWTSTTTISGLSGYEYSIGTTAGGTDILNWTSAGTSTSATSNSLSLVTSQTYYFNVRVTDNAGNTAIISSNGVLVAPTLTFSTSSNTVNFNALNASNSYTASQTLTLTTTTNAKNGYQVYGRATGLLSNQSAHTIAMFNGGTYASPAAWGSNTGFGYNSSDTSVGGTNRFNSTTCLGGGSAPCFAPYSLIGIGEVVADSSGTPAGGPALNDTTTITNKVSVSGTTQQSGRYQTTVLYSAYATY